MSTIEELRTNEADMLRGVYLGDVGSFPSWADLAPDEKEAWTRLRDFSVMFFTSYAGLLAARLAPTVSVVSPFADAPELEVVIEPPSAQMFVASTPHDEIVGGLSALLKRAAMVKMSPLDLYEQRRSFVRGQVGMSHPDWSAEEIQARVDAVLPPLGGFRSLGANVPPQETWFGLNFSLGVEWALNKRKGNQAIPSIRTAAIVDDMLDAPVPSPGPNDPKLIDRSPNSPIFSEVGAGGETVPAATLAAALTRLNDEICQVLGKALGYPWFKDDPKTFPGAGDAAGVCVGAHVAESIAAEAAARITALSAENQEFRRLLEKACTAISLWSPDPTEPLVEIEAALGIKAAAPQGPAGATSR